LFVVDESKGTQATSASLISKFPYFLRPISSFHYNIEGVIPNEKLIKCMHMISLHKDNKITKRELKDLALNNNLIQVGRKDTQDKEERIGCFYKDFKVRDLEREKNYEKPL
jgi:hypothetical protein